MTKPEPTKPVPLPALLVYGKPTSADLPQASWFRISDRQAVAAAAHALKLTIIDIAAEEDRALLAGVHEGVLKTGGRLIVGSVTVDVYKRIEEHTAKASASPAALASSDNAAAPKSATEQNKNTSGAGKAGSAPVPPAGKRDLPPTRPRDPWDALRVGDHVVAKYWETDGSPYGWWVGVIVEIVTDGVFIIRWPDEQKTPPLKIGRKHVAILHPSYDVNTEWQRRR